MISKLCIVNHHAMLILSHFPSQPCVVTISLPHYTSEELCNSQSKDTTISIVLQARLTSPDIPHAPMWNKSSILQIEATLAPSIVCRQYSPSPTQQSFTVPVLPHQLQQDAISHNHDALQQVT